MGQSPSSPGGGPPRPPPHHGQPPMGSAEEYSDFEDPTSINQIPNSAQPERRNGRESQQGMMPQPMPASMQQPPPQQQTFSAGSPQLSHLGPPQHQPTHMGPMNTMTQQPLMTQQSVAAQM